MSTRRQLFNSTSSQHSQQSRETIEYNIAVLGALGSGKSALTVKYITRRFIVEYDPTLEDVYSKQDQVDHQDVTLKIMDTYDKHENAGRHLKWAHGFLVLYSITSKSSLTRAQYYLDILAENQRITGLEKPFILVGNKIDLERYRTVSQSDGKKLANQYDCVFKEISVAEDFESVEKLFHLLTRDIRLNEQLMPLQPLFISEDKTGLLSTSVPIPNRRRTKSPKNSESKEQRAFPRRIEKIFNKSFKIFN